MMSVKDAKPSRTSIFQQSIQKLRILSMKTDASLCGLVGGGGGGVGNIIWNVPKQLDTMPENEWIAAKFMYHLLSEEQKYQSSRNNFRENRSLFQRSLEVMKHVFMGATKKYCDKLFQWISLSHTSPNFMVFSMQLMF
jgi:hypothetical protein